jgi:hypothetical protein
LGGQAGFAHGALLVLVAFWPKTDAATISDATIHGFVFVSKFSIFALHFGRIIS